MYIDLLFDRSSHKIITTCHAPNSPARTTVISALYKDRIERVKGEKEISCWSTSHEAKALVWQSFATVQNQNLLPSISTDVNLNRELDEAMLEAAHWRHQLASRA